MSIEVQREIGEWLTAQKLGDEQPCEPEWKRCEHAFAYHYQPELPDPIRSIGQCYICNHTFDGADIARQLEPLHAQRDQARTIAVRLEGECALLEQERDAALLRAERAEKACWRCGGAA